MMAMLALPDVLSFLSPGLRFFHQGQFERKLQDQLSSASYEWNGDDLAERGLCLDISPWQAAVFDLVTIR